VLIPCRKPHHPHQIGFIWFHKIKETLSATGIGYKGEGNLPQGPRTALDCEGRRVWYKPHKGHRWDSMGQNARQVTCDQPVMLDALWSQAHSAHHQDCWCHLEMCMTTVIFLRSMCIISPLVCSRADTISSNLLLKYTLHLTLCPSTSNMLVKLFGS
jgi:hypothetical protein